MLMGVEYPIRHILGCISVRLCTKSDCSMKKVNGSIIYLEEIWKPLMPPHQVLHMFVLFERGDCKRLKGFRQILPPTALVYFDICIRRGEKKPFTYFKFCRRDFEEIKLLCANEQIASCRCLSLLVSL